MMSTSSVVLLVDKATSDLLIEPDWAMNVEICDHINSHPWHGKDFVKAVKRRLQHKNPKIQFLSLTLLETMVKNCGDLIHFKVAEKNIPREMVKMVKRRAEMHVHDKILVLLDAWQEVFGGQRGKHPQYYYAYDELRRSGIPFPKHSADAAPILTPPPTQSTSQVENGLGNNNPLERLENAMTTEIEGLSISTMGSTKNVMELLNDMLRSINPKDCDAVNDEIIVDLVNQCRANQKKLMQMLTTTNDEELLSQGLKLNDNMQNLLAKHDAIAFGIPLSSPLNRSSSHRPDKQKVPSPQNKEIVVDPSYDDEKEEEGRRQSELQPSFEISASASASASTSGESTSLSPTPSSPSTSTCCSCKALALSSPPPPSKTPKEKDLIDLLSLSITTTSSPQSPQTPSPNQNTPQDSFSMQNSNPYTPHSTSSLGPLGHGSTPYDSYIAPWAHPANPNPQPLMTQQFQSQTLQPQYFQPIQPQYSAAQNSSYYNPYSSPMSTPEHSYTTNQNTFLAAQAYGTLLARTNSTYQHTTSLPASPINITPIKPFVPSYRLFEELNVLGPGAEGRLKVSNGVSPSLSGSSSQSMVGGGGR